MKFGKIKKLLTCIALSATVACMAATAAGCSAETDHPEVSITYEFNGKAYVIEYTLYRNMYPNTVRHFLELTENGFYNNTVIHDMESNDWFGGAYEYNKDEYASLTENGNDAMKEYYETYSKEQAYYDLFNAGKLSTTVYSNIAYNGQTQILDAKYKMATLIGEFSDNQHTIEKGALTAEYGCLKMYYSSKKTKGKVYVTPASGGHVYSDYSKNCATYVFGMQVGTTSTYVASQYCVFAKIKNDDALEKFVEAVEDYNNDTYGTTVSEHYTQPVVDVDKMESFSEEAADKGIEETFRSPKTAIIIKNVKIVKY
ncbi:MAG: peptidylprolyl isomerase [Clostridiales bacterium]|nr:peptidylprolyl isomerase [Clostridiales bacterium]